MQPIQAVLFDLDGTLLPMDQATFLNAYFAGLARFLLPHGYEPHALIETVTAGSYAMIANDGSRSNEEAFWQVMRQRFGAAVQNDLPKFDAFYREAFPRVQAVCGFEAGAGALVRALRAAGLTVALATSPIFPRVATEERMRWAGLKWTDFDLVTTYENCSVCKPNPAYYTHVAAALGVDAARCLMVGNDLGDDGAARLAGMDLFVLTDCLINPQNLPLDMPHGSFADLVRYLQPLLGSNVQ